MTNLAAIIGAGGWLVLTFAAAAVGARFMPDAWYKRLKKPTWNPPSAVFAPVWTILYLLMAAAAWLVWRQAGFTGALFPLTLFVAQLLLNTAWTWFFFGHHEIRRALIDIVVLWIGIVATVISFWRLVPLAGALMLPYLAWVSFATVLTWTIWQLNSKGFRGGLPQEKESLVNYNLRDLLPYIFYVAGSVCFVIGSVLSMLQRIKGPG